MMFSVRIKRDGETFTFGVAQFNGYGIEAVAIDSTPHIIAFVNADDPGQAAARAWAKGEEEALALANLGGMKGLLAAKESQ